MSGEADSRHVLRNKKAVVACAKRNTTEMRGDSVATRYRRVPIPQFTHGYVHIEVELFQQLCRLQ
jgi:hypothetical protein